MSPLTEQYFRRVGEEMKGILALTGDLQQSMADLIKLITIQKQMIDNNRGKLDDLEKRVAELESEEPWVDSGLMGDT